MHSNAEFVFTGDYNIDLFSSKSDDFTNVLLSANLYPTIFLPTRVTKHSSTLIDNFFTNTQLSWNSGVFNSDLSDHFMIFLCIHITNLETNKSKSFLNKQVNMSGFVHDVSCLSWDFITDASSVDSDCEHLTSLLSSCLLKNTNASLITFNPKSPWMTPGLYQSCIHKHKLYKQAIKGEIPMHNYNAYRNRLTHSIRLRKAQFYEELSQRNKTNAKSLWQHIKSLLGHCQPSISTASFVDSNVINDFFSNLGPSTVANLPSTNTSYTDFIKPMLHSFVLSNVTLNELINTINDLNSKKSCGFDGLTSNHIKSISHIIVHPLLKLINKSFTIGIFPSVLKIARVIPIHKGGDLNELINYRPISILPTVSKIFERLIHIRLESFINKYHILSDSQHGFRKGYNTETALISTINYISKSLDNKTPLVALYVDIAKAFDSLDHQILLDKLHLLGFRGIIHKWLTSYLANRFQYTELSGCRSNLRLLSKGVPQGSILGPLLFLIYINDITTVSDLLHFTLFADDTTILAADKSLLESLNPVTDRLSIIFNWFLSNRLCINVKKTQCMFFGFDKQRLCNNILVHQCVINRVSHTKFLGVHIDDKLSWSYQIDYVCNQLSKSLGMLKVASHVFPSDVLRKLYYAYFLCHLSYGLTVWGNTYTSYLHPLKILHNRCIRLLSFANPYAHVAPLAKHLHILIFDDLYYYNVAIFMYKVFNNSCPSVISELFTRRLTQSHVTRHTEHSFFLPRVNLDLCKKLVTFAGVNIWSHLSVNTKSQSNINRFKQCLLAELMQKYDDI